jgi:hypothetical protein
VKRLNRQSGRLCDEGGRNCEQKSCGKVAKRVLAASLHRGFSELAISAYGGIDFAVVWVD